MAFLSGCGKIPFLDDEEEISVAPPPPVYPEIDECPAWSPEGSVIVYYHNGITTVKESGSCHVEPESVGLWFISPTGDTRRMFLKGNNRLPAGAPRGSGLPLPLTIISRFTR
ncbi:MAG: hypothetical protein AB1797_09990 [bacterium]